MAVNGSASTREEVEKNCSGGCCTVAYGNESEEAGEEVEKKNTNIVCSVNNSQNVRLSSYHR